MNRFYHQLNNYVLPFLKRVFVPWLYMKQLEQVSEDIINDSAESYTYFVEHTEMLEVSKSLSNMAFGALLHVARKTTNGDLSGTIFINPEWLNKIISYDYGDESPVVGVSSNGKMYYLLMGMFILEPCELIPTGGIVIVPNTQIKEVKKGIKDHNLGYINKFQIPYIGPILDQLENAKVNEFIMKSAITQQQLNDSYTELIYEDEDEDEQPD